MTTTDINIEELLNWYADAGVDIALLDEPVDQFAASEKLLKKNIAPQNKSPAPNTGPQSLAKPAVSQGVAANTVPTPSERTVPDSNAIAKAQALSAGAQTLAELRSVMESFDSCNLKFSARSTVFADGNPNARIMFVGEAPGREEDAQGLPFVGKSGQFLDKMLASIGLDRTKIYISNVMPWRPPGNRTPTKAETDICRPFIQRHIELIDPDFLVFVGGSAAKTLMESKSGIMSVRGKWTDVSVGEKTYPALPTLHPAYLLRQPGHKHMAWADLLAIKRKYETSNKLDEVV